jgi:hypothetical protein
LKNFLTAEQLFQAIENPETMPYLTMRAEELDVKEFLNFYNTIETLRKL